MAFVGVLADIILVALVSTTVAGAGANLLVNGSFESGGTGWLAPWYLGTRTGAAASIVQSADAGDATHAAAVTVTLASPRDPWLIQLSQEHVGLTAGHAYALTFLARSSSARSIEAIVQQTPSPYAVRANRAFTLGEAWTSYELGFTSATTEPDVAVRFNLAQATGTVWIDGVSLVDASGSPSPSPSATGSPSPTPGPTATPTRSPRPSPTVTPSPPAPTPTPTPSATPSVDPGATTAVVGAIADATVRAAQPTVNAGSAPTLVSDGSPVMAAYLTFDLTPVEGRTITAASLELRAVRNSRSSHRVHAVADTGWSELGVTWATRPAVGNVLGTIVGARNGAWSTVDVSSIVAGRTGGLVSFAVDTSESDALSVSSREGTAGPPRLRLALEPTGPTPTPTPVPTPTPTPSPSPGVSSGKGVALRPFAEFWGSDAQGMASDLDDLIGAGIGWARIDLDLATFPSSAFDTAVALADARGIRLLAVVHKPSPTMDLGSVEEQATYRSLLGAAVERYRSSIRDWEIQNEPNLHYEWAIDETPTSDPVAYEAAVRDYLELLRQAYGVVKGVDPGATVFFGGLSEWTVERYLDVVLATDASASFDAFSFHPYGSDPSHCVGRFRAMQAKVATVAAYAAKPIWITEIGFNTSWSNLAGYVKTEELKATYLAQVLPGLRDAGAAGPLFWYTLHENDRSPGFGLEVKDARTRSTTFLPAYARYRDLPF